MGWEEALKLYELVHFLSKENDANNLLVCLVAGIKFFQQSL